MLAISHFRDKIDGRLARYSSTGVSMRLGSQRQPVITSPLSQPAKMEEPQTAVLPLLGLMSVVY